MEEVSCLQIYSSFSPITESFILGNREGLLRLKEMIEKTLETGCETENFILEKDKEYSLNVSCLNVVCLDDLAKGFNSDAQLPIQIQVV